MTVKIQHIIVRCLSIKLQTVQNASASCCYIWSHIANTIFYWTWLRHFSENAFSIWHDVILQNLKIEFQSCTWLHSRTIEQNGFFEQAEYFFLSRIWRSQHPNLLSEHRAVFHHASDITWSQSTRDISNISLKKGYFVINCISWQWFLSIVSQWHYTNTYFIVVLSEDFHGQ